MVAVVLFAGIYLLGTVDLSTFEATSLFVVPIALCAIEFGVWGGLGAALLGLALVFAADLTQLDADLGAMGYLSRGVAFLLFGGLLGRFVTARRALEDKIARAEELSPDLIARTSFDGYFKRLNPAWERALGWSTDELCSRPLLDFVHPEDRERTVAEMAKLTDGSEAIGFRNRYRARDGSYRGLEWNARGVTSDETIYASARDVTALERAEEAIQRYGEGLERTVRERTGELEQARLETLQRLALAAEYRDDDTHQHTERVGHTSMLIARELGLPEETVRRVRHAAPLHDIGKLGVSDTILLNPGKLTAQEHQTMQEHTRTGGSILANSSSRVLRTAEEIALTHHERWDGTGYPEGLADQEIPLTARITAIADVFDALTRKRPYKDAWSVDAALAEIRLDSGTHFDPAAVEAFLALDHTTLVQQTLSYHEQTLSDADQMVSDRDRMASDRDQMASEEDELASTRDQDTSDREQAAADAGGDAQDPAAHARNRAARQALTQDRYLMSQLREETALERGRAAGTRDVTARARDEAAHMRDRIADARDADSHQQDGWSGSILDGTSDVAAIRKHAARDRYRAATDREDAARDREQARQVREDAARERMQAARERAEAAHDRELAVTDPLTGARVRRAGLAELQREIDRARRTTGSLVLAFVDVDHLKQVNDADGHPAGDRLLAAVASALRDGLRSYDLIVRFGGDEFVCAVSGIAAAEVQERFGEIAKQLAVRSDGHSFSAGFAELQDGDDTQQLIARADDALLQAKRAS